MPVGVRRIPWQGGEHDFCISPLGHVLSLEEACGCGVAQVYKRLVESVWFAKDVRETIRLALIGGGQTPEKALALVKANVDENPNGMAPGVVLAIAVLEAYFVGVKDDPVGKKKRKRAEQVSSTTTDDSADR